MVARKNLDGNPCFCFYSHMTANLLDIHRFVLTIVIGGPVLSIATLGMERSTIDGPVAKDTGA